MNEILSCTKNQFRRWLASPKEVFVFFFAFMFINLGTGELGKLCVHYKTAMTPWLYPFLFEAHYYIFLFFINVVLLFSDAPFMNETQLFYILRSGKRKWFYGQAIYMLLASLLYSLFIFLGTLVIMMPYMKFSLEWGKIIETFSLTSSPYSFVGIGRSIVDNFTPLEAVLACFALNTLAGLFLGLLIYDLNLLFHRGVGSACALVLLIFQYVLEEPEGWSYIIMKYFVPVCWMDLTFYHDRVEGISLAYPFAVLPLICLVLFFLGRHLTDQCTFCTQEEF